MPPTFLKQASLRPAETVAGATEEFVISLEIGPDYTDGPSRIVYDFPAMVGMSRPSLDHQEESGFIRAYVSNPDVNYVEGIWDIELVDFVTRERRSHRGMALRMFVLDLSAGLREGDRIVVRWGDTGGGYGAGTKVTSVVPRPNYACVIDVRYFDDPESALPDMGRSYEGHERPTPTCEVPLAFRVRPREATRLRLVRKWDRALLSPLDVFWNVAEDAEPETLFGADAQAKPNAEGVFEFDAPHVIVRSRGLPLNAAPPMDDVFEGLNLYWGDIHTHSAFSNDCIEREKLGMGPGDLMRFARDRAALDFFAVTDHHQPWDAPRNRIGREFWDRTKADLAEYDRSGAFLVFPGFEFRCPRGDTVIVTNWKPSYDEIDRPEWTDVREVWRGLAGRDFLSIPHFHNPGGLDENTWWSPEAEGVEPVLEVFSCHGSFEAADVLERKPPLIKRRRADRNGVWILEQGRRFGFVANSDGHKGHVGTNGLTAVFADRLEKDAILAAYRARRVYATTNARIRLVFTANGELMGAALPETRRKDFRVDAMAEGALKKVDLLRNGVLHTRWAPTGNVCRRELAIEDEGPSWWHVRATQLDGHVAWSSPVWFGG